jgi:hypothetical protein
MEGERELVTVLFADLKGSMELLADRDPEEARKLLDPVLDRMMEAVHRYEGTVNQVMGDGIMALFGAPLAHEDHAVRACYAALRMQEAVKRYAEEVHRSAGVPLHIRVGVNSGEVVVRSIGSDLHMDYTAVGQTTHLAARLEQMAMPGSILIAPTSWPNTSSKKGASRTSGRSTSDEGAGQSGDGPPLPLTLICTAFGVPRSSVYATAPAPAAATGPARGKPGPKTPVSDGELVTEIRAVLGARPFHGEGYRKVRARLAHRGRTVKNPWGNAPEK